MCGGPTSHILPADVAFICFGEVLSEVFALLFFGCEVGVLGAFPVAYRWQDEG